MGCVRSARSHDKWAARDNAHCWPNMTLAHAVGTDKVIGEGAVFYAQFQCVRKLRALPSAAGIDKVVGAKVDADH